MYKTEKAMWAWLSNYWRALAEMFSTYRERRAGRFLKAAPKRLEGEGVIGYGAAWPKRVAQRQGVSIGMELGMLLRVLIGLVAAVGIAVAIVGLSSYHWASYRFRPKQRDEDWPTTVV
jgi:hypothetical protein